MSPRGGNMEAKSRFGSPPGGQNKDLMLRPLFFWASGSLRGAILEPLGLDFWARFWKVFGAMLRFMLRCVGGCSRCCSCWLASIFSVSSWRCAAYVFSGPLRESRGETARNLRKRSQLEAPRLERAAHSRGISCWLLSLLSLATL